MSPSDRTALATLMALPIHNPERQSLRDAVPYSLGANMSYPMTTQKQVRAAFWAEHKGLPGITPRQITNYSGNGKMHNTDTRCAFCDFVDYLSKGGQISESLAARVTL